MPRKVFTAGEVLAAADVNEFLQDQAVMTFADTAARGSAIGTAVEGMVTYLEDINSLSVYNGTDWTTDRTIQVFGGTAARGSAISSPVEGMYTHINDTDSLQYYNGSSWVPLLSFDWSAYTPTFTNMTIGNATVNFRYSQIGKNVTVQGDVTFGSTTSISGMPVISLPVTASSQLAPSTQLGGAYAEDAGLTGFALMFRLNNTTSMNVLAFGAGGTWLTTAPVSSTIPFTWGTGDLFRFTITYEAA
jgi:hypothetical protein